MSARLASFPPASLEACNLGPLPLYLPLFHDLNLLDLFNQHLPQDPQQEFSHGQVLQALLLARLTQPTALVNISHWAHESGAATLLGIPAEKLNDDRLGRALDAFFEHRHSLMAHFTSAALKWADIHLKRLNTDHTDITFTGSYTNSVPRPTRFDTDLLPYDADLPPAHISHGYLTKRRMINACVSAYVDDLGFVPIFVHPFDGNRNGHPAIRQQYELLQQHFTLPNGLLMTSDRGTLSADHLARLYRHGHHALCAAPWMEYQKLYEAHAPSLQWKRASYLSQEQQRRRKCSSTLTKDHYDIAVVDHTITDPLPRDASTQTPVSIPIRVIFVRGTASQREEAERRRQNIVKIKAGFVKLAAKLLRGHPNCRPEKICAQVEKLLGKRAAKACFAYQMVPLTPEEQAALPKPASGHKRATHRLEWQFDEEAAKMAEGHDGLAALVTTAPLSWSGDELFTEYKRQAYVERSHHEYKTPLAVRPVFLKSPQRVEALVCLVMLALQFRQVVERRYRQKQQKDTDEKERRMTAERLERAFRNCHAVTWEHVQGTVLTPVRVRSEQREILQVLGFPSVHRQLQRYQSSG